MAKKSDRPDADIDMNTENWPERIALVIYTNTIAYEMRFLKNLHTLGRKTLRKGQAAGEITVLEHMFEAFVTDAVFLRSVSLRLDGKEGGFNPEAKISLSLNGAKVLDKRSIADLMALPKGERLEKISSKAVHGAHALMDERKVDPKVWLGHMCTNGVSAKVDVHGLSLKGAESTIEVEFSAAMYTTKLPNGYTPDLAYPK